MTDHDAEDDPEGRPGDADDQDVARMSAQVSAPSIDVDVIATVDDDGTAHPTTGDYGSEGKVERPETWDSYVADLVGDVFRDMDTGAFVELLGDVNGFAAYRHVEQQGGLDETHEARVFLAPWSTFEDRYAYPKGGGDGNNGP